MTAVLETNGLGKRYGEALGAPRLHPDHPRRQGRRARRAERGGKDDPAASGRRAARADARERSRCSADARVTAPPTRPRRLRRPGHARPTHGCRWPSTFAWAPSSTRSWDHELAAEPDRALDLDPRQRAGSLSGGQRAQLALTLAIAKRPELLLLDEPVASLDPLARREFLQGLMEVVAEHGVSVVLSSHLVADLERVCDYLVVLVASHVQLAGEVERAAGLAPPPLRSPPRPGAPSRRTSK